MLFGNRAISPCSSYLKNWVLNLFQERYCPIPISFAFLMELYFQKAIFILGIYQQQGVTCGITGMLFLLFKLFLVIGPKQVVWLCRSFLHLAGKSEARHKHSLQRLRIWNKDTPAHKWCSARVCTCQCFLNTRIYWISLVLLHTDPCNFLPIFLHN